MARGADGYSNSVCGRDKMMKGNLESMGSCDGGEMNVFKKEEWWVDNKTQLSVSRYAVSSLKNKSELIT